MKYEGDSKKKIEQTSPEKIKQTKESIEKTSKKRDDAQKKLEDNKRLNLEKETAKKAAEGEKAIRGIPFIPRLEITELNFLRIALISVLLVFSLFIYNMPKYQNTNVMKEQTVVEYTILNQFLDTDDLYIGLEEVALYEDGRVQYEINLTNVSESDTYTFLLKDVILEKGDVYSQLVNFSTEALEDKLILNPGDDIIIKFTFLIDEQDLSEYQFNIYRFKNETTDETFDISFNLSDEINE